MEMKTIERFNKGFDLRYINQKTPMSTIIPRNNEYASMQVSLKTVGYQFIDELHSFIDINIMEHIVENSNILKTVYIGCSHEHILQTIEYVILQYCGRIHGKCLLLDNDLLLRCHGNHNLTLQSNEYICYVGDLFGLPIYSVPYSLNLKSNYHISIIDNNSITLCESNHTRHRNHKQTSFAVYNVTDKKPVIIPLHVTFTL